MSRGRNGCSGPPAGFLGAPSALRSRQAPLVGPSQDDGGAGAATGTVFTQQERRER